MLHKHVFTSLFFTSLFACSVFLLNAPARVQAVADSVSSRSGQARQLQLQQEQIKADREQLKANRENLVEDRNALVEQRCATAQEKTAQQIAKFDGMKSELDARYEKYIKKLQTIVTKLKAEGVATADLEQDTETLISLVAEMTTALSLYADKVEAAQQLAPNCGSAQGEFKLALQGARLQLQEVRAKSQAIRSFMTGTLKDDLYAARQELQAMKKAASPKPIQ